MIIHYIRSLLLFLVNLNWWSRGQAHQHHQCLAHVAPPHGCLVGPHCSIAPWIIEVPWLLRPPINSPVSEANNKATKRTCTEKSWDRQVFFLTWRVVNRSLHMVAIPQSESLARQWNDHTVAWNTHIFRTGHRQSFSIQGRSRSCHSFCMSGQIYEYKKNIIYIRLYKIII